MPLGEAVVYLKRAVRRRFGTKVVVQLKDGEGATPPFPVVLINGEVFCQGHFSYREIIQELTRLQT